MISTPELSKMINYVRIPVLAQYAVCHWIWFITWNRKLCLVKCLRSCPHISDWPPSSNLARATADLANAFSRRIVNCQTPLLIVRIDVLLSTRRVCFLKRGVLIVLRSDVCVVLTLGPAMTNALPHRTLMKYCFLKPGAEYYIYCSSQVKMMYVFLTGNSNMWFFPVSPYILFHLLKQDGGLGFKCFVNSSRRNRFTKHVFYA